MRKQWRPLAPERPCLREMRPVGAPLQRVRSLEHLFQSENKKTESEMD
jgi:hypothetical protein